MNLSSLLHFNGSALGAAQKKGTQGHKCAAEAGCQANSDQLGSSNSRSGKNQPQQRKNSHNGGISDDGSSSSSLISHSKSHVTVARSASGGNISSKSSLPPVSSSSQFPTTTTAAAPAELHYQNFQTNKSQLQFLLSHPLIKKLHLKRKKIAMIFKVYVVWRDTVLQRDLGQEGHGKSNTSVETVTQPHDQHAANVAEGTNVHQEHNEQRDTQNLESPLNDAPPKSIIYSLYHYFHGSLSKTRPFFKRKMTQVVTTQVVTTIVSGGATTSNAVVLPSAGAAMGASITATNGTSSATTAHRATTPLSSSSLDSTTGSSVQHQYSQIHSRTASTDSWGSVSSGGVKHLHTGTPIAQTTSDRATTTTSANGMPSTKRQIYILCLWNILLIDLQWNRNNSLERRDDFVFFYKSMVDLNGNGHLGMRKFADINATDSNEEASCDNGVVGNASGTASSRCSTSPTVSIDFDKKPHAMSIPLIHFLVQSLLLDHDETNCNMESMQSSLNLLQTILQQDLRLYGSSPSVPSSGINSHLLSGTQCHVAHHKKEHAHYNILLIGHVLRRMQEERQLSQKELLVWTKIKKGRDSTLLIDLIEQVMYFPPWNPNHLCASLHSSRSMPPTQSSLGIHVENSTTTHERLTLFRGTENLHLRDIIAPLCDVQKLIKKYFRPDAPISGGHTRSPGSDSKRRRHISHSPGRSFHMDFPVSPLKTSPNFPSSPLSPTPFALRRASKPDPFTPRSPQVKSLLGFPSLTSSFNENSILSFGESDDDEYTMNAFNSLDDYSQDDETGARQFAQHASTHTTITVKLCLYPVKQSKLKQLKHIPPLHLTSSPQSMFGLYHSALIVGKWNLFWDPHTELIIPSYPFSYTSSRGVGAPLLALDIAEFDKEDLNSLRTIIGTQVVKWNTEFKYGTRSTISKQRKKQEKLEKKLGKQQERNMKKIAQKEKKGYLPSRHEYPMPDTPITPASGIASNGGSPVDTFVDARVSPRSGSSPPHSRSSGTADSPQDSSVRHPFAKMGNCQDFVDHMLNTLGLSLKSLDSPSLDSPVVSYFAHLSRTGKASHTFLLTDTFKQHFKIRDVHAWAASWNLHVPSANILKFKTHRDLDSFVHFLKETDPNVDKKFDGSWKLLKSFDRGFWIEYIRLHVKREQILLDSLHDPQQRAANTSKLAAIDEELKRVEPAFDSNDVLMCPFANPLDRSFCVTPNSSDDEFSDVERDGMLWKQSDNDDWMPPHHDVEKPLPAVHVIERSLEKGLLKRIDK